MMLLRTSLAWMLCAAFLMTISGLAMAQDASNPVVCTVDGKKITQQELLSEIDKMIKMAGNQVRPDMIPQLKVMLYGRALNGLQEKILLKNVAEKKNIVVEEKDIDERYNEIRKQFASEDQFKQVLSSNGLTPESLKDRMKEDFLYVKVLEEEVKEPAAPGEEDIKKFYDENKEKMKQEEEVTASHILIQVEKTASAEEKEAAKKKLQGIRQDIMDQKTTFADAAQQNSDCPSKARGGALGSFGRGRMAPEFEKAAFALKAGEISDIVETQFGYHIIQVNGHQDAKLPTLEESKDQIKEYLQQEGTQKARQDYVEALKEDAKIETMIDEKAWADKFGPKEEKQEEGQTLQLSPDDLNP
ncbi:MAG: foldase protein PrsA [Candidatus Hinthialibacter sp.]